MLCWSVVSAAVFELIAGLGKKGLVMLEQAAVDVGVEAPVDGDVEENTEVVIAEEEDDDREDDEDNANGDEEVRPGLTAGAVLLCCLEWLGAGPYRANVGVGDRYAKPLSVLITRDALGSRIGVPAVECGGWRPSSRASSND